jgi:hypothetical protein
VDIVAFSLDQQREIFRQANFDSQGFDQLATALKSLQLGVVSYRALERGSSSEFLVRFARDEITAGNPPDALIFIGSNNHFLDKVHAQLVLEPRAPRLFYFEYYGYRTPFPDSIDYLMQDLHGTVFRINSAREFGTAVQRMLGLLRQSKSNEVP